MGEPHPASTCPANSTPAPDHTLPPTTSTQKLRCNPQHLYKFIMVILLTKLFTKSQLTWEKGWLTSFTNIYFWLWLGECGCDLCPLWPHWGPPLPFPMYGNPWVYYALMGHTDPPIQCVSENKWKQWKGPAFITSNLSVETLWDVQTLAGRAMAVRATRCPITGVNVALWTSPSFLKPHNCWTIRTNARRGEQMDEKSRWQLAQQDFSPYPWHTDGHLMDTQLN